MNHRLEDRLRRAAALRASSQSWEKVARCLGVTVRTCRNWPRRYAPQWNRLFLEQQSVVLADVSLESVFILRQLLRGQKENVRRDAARILIDFRVRTLQALERSHGRHRPPADPLESLLESLDAETEAGAEPSPLEIENRPTPKAEPSPADRATEVPAGKRRRRPE